MKEFIIFDVMGVIFTVGDDTNDLLVPYILERKPQTQKDTIKRLYLEASLGRIHSGEFWTGCGFSADEIKAAQKTYLDTRLTLDPGFIECAKVLKQKYRLALLSNDVSEWSRYLRKRHHIDDYIDYAFISGAGFKKARPQDIRLRASRNGGKALRMLVHRRFSRARRRCRRTRHSFDTVQQG